MLVMSNPDAAPLPADRTLAPSGAPALATAFEAEELEPELETLAALGTVETGADADWLAPGAEGDLDDDEVEAWLDAYEAVLAEG